MKSTALMSFSLFSIKEGRPFGAATSRHRAAGLALNAATSLSAPLQAGNIAAPAAAAGPKVEDGAKAILSVHALRKPGITGELTRRNDRGGGSGDPGRDYLCILASRVLLHLILYRLHLLWEAGPTPGRGLLGSPPWCTGSQGGGAPVHRPIACTGPQKGC